MKAVILCDDFEKGLLPINERTPVSMIEIAGKTPAERAVRAVAEGGEDGECVANKIYAVGSYLSERMRFYFETRYFGGVRPEFVAYDSDICGALCGISGGEDILALDCTAIRQTDFGRFLNFFGQSDASAAICAAKPNGSLRGYKIRSEGGILTYFSDDEFVPDISCDGLFCGAAVFSGDLFERLKGEDCRNCRTLAELVAKAYAADEKIAVYRDESFLPLCNTADFLNCAHELLRRADVLSDSRKPLGGVYSADEISLSGITLIPPVYIGRGVSLGKGCVIENCTIGDNAVIGERAELHGCFVGEAAEIGAGVSAENCAVCASAAVRPSARLGEYSAVGEKAVVGSGGEIMPSVSVYSERRTAAGDIISEDAVCSDCCRAVLDDDCCCGFSAGRSAAGECMRLALAVGYALPEGALAVCGAGGNGSQALLMSFESGLAASGVNVISVGQANSREVMFLVNRLGAQIGCCINSQFSERVQLMQKGGLAPDCAFQARVERAAALGRVRLLPYERYGRRHNLADAKALYRIFLSQLLPPIFHGLNADVRCPDIAAAKLADELIRPRNDIDGERTVFHISNDGTACTAYTEDTGYVTGERLILLAVKAAFEKEIPVSLPYTFPMAADKIAERTGGALYRYFHSSADNSDAAARRIAERPDNFFVRDGMVLMCTVCAYLSERAVTLAEALSDIPEFYSAQRFAAFGGSPEELYSRLGCRREGGGGVVISDSETRATVRPLRNRQGLIIFTESVKAEAASELCDDISQKLKKFD